MKAQQEEDCIRCNQDKHHARHKADLEKQSRITAIIASVAKRFRPKDILKPDGSNIWQWERMVRLHALECFNDPDFSLRESNAVIDMLDKLLARGIIHALVNSDLT
jgi:hypothetical protein